MHVRPVHPRGTVWLRHTACPARAQYAIVVNACTLRLSAPVHTGGGQAPGHMLVCADVHVWVVQSGRFPVWPGMVGIVGKLAGGVSGGRG